MPIVDLDNWADKANEDRWGGPQWSWDCGKMIYEGHLLAISSNFYPPGDEETWSGSVIVVIRGTPVGHKEFKCTTLEDLKSEVESYVNDLVSKIESQVREIFS